MQHRMVHALIIRPAKFTGVKARHADTDAEHRDSRYDYRTTRDFLMAIGTAHQLLSTQLTQSSRVRVD